MYSITEIPQLSDRPQKVPVVPILKYIKVIRVLCKIGRWRELWQSEYGFHNML
jgi:hypothetical protein